MIKMNFGGTATGGVEAARVRPLAGLSGMGFIRAGFIRGADAKDASSIVLLRRLAGDVLANMGESSLVAYGGRFTSWHSGCWSECGKGMTS